MKVVIEEGKAKVTANEEGIKLLAEQEARTIKQAQQELKDKMIARIENTSQIKPKDKRLFYKLINLD